LFTSFLINEIICYGNNIDIPWYNKCIWIIIDFKYKGVKNIIDLKIKTKEFIDVIKQKLDLYKNRTNINVDVNKNK
jgi:poly(A) polymerase Pap1